MLVSDLITEAWIDIDEITVGRLISGPEQADSFARLNDLLAQWSTEELSVYTVAHTSFAVTAATAAYTLGPGGSLAIANPAVCVTGATSISGAFQSKVDVVSFEELHSRIANQRGRTTVLAELVAADQSYPLINVLVYPTPAVAPGALWLDYWQALASFATVGDTVSFPPGYAKALRLNLAMELYGPYARHTRPGKAEWLAAEAKAAKASLIELHLKIQRGQVASEAALAPRMPQAVA